MYSSVKLCIRQFSSLSDFFNSNVGVKQGEPLSPFFFLLYINDLADELRCSIDENLDELSICLLLFAEDLVIVAKSPEELQSLINELFVYCQEWNPSVNIKKKKTKVVIFEKKKSNNEIAFHYGDNELDIVDSYVYLGINIKNNGTLKPAMELLCNQAIRTVFGMKSIYNFGIMDISTKLKLFDSIIKPILLYGCEIWGFENNKAIEAVQIRFYKSILGLNRNCSNVVVFGELPMQILCKIRIIKYWCNLITKRHSLQYKLYSLLYIDCCYTVCKNWASNVRN